MGTRMGQVSIHFLALDMKERLMPAELIYYRYREILFIASAAVELSLAEAAAARRWTA